MIVKSMFALWVVGYHSPEYSADGRRSGGWILVEARWCKVNLSRSPQVAGERGGGVLDALVFEGELPRLVQMAAGTGAGLVGAGRRCVHGAPIVRRGS